MADRAETVAGHYETEGLAERILAALEGEGVDLAALTPEILHPIDHFHTGGVASTRKLAEMAEITPEMTVLDIGSGVGGPARFLAQTYGCTVVGIDLTVAFCEAARVLSERCGLAALTRFEQGDALALPFEDATFDLVWSQNVTMNIADKARFFAEAARVAKPGAKLLIQEMSAGSGAPHYPLPWASEPSISFLVPPDALVRIVDEAGFRVIETVDDSAAIASPAGSAANQRRLGRLGVPLLMGPEFPSWSANNARSLGEGLLIPLRLLGERAPRP